MVSVTSWSVALKTPKSFSGHLSSMMLMQDALDPLLSSTPSLTRHPVEHLFIVPINWQLCILFVRFHPLSNLISIFVLESTPVSISQEFTTWCGDRPFKETVGQSDNADERIE